jgi:hypothetical protein
MPIIFDGSDGQPFELITQRLPTATAEDKTVVLTLSVFAAGFPQATAELQVRLGLAHAEQLAAQMQPAVKMAQVRSRAYS